MYYTPILTNCLWPFKNSNGHSSIICSRISLMLNSFNLYNYCVHELSISITTAATLLSLTKHKPRSFAKWWHTVLFCQNCRILTLVLRFYFYAHLLCLGQVGGKKAQRHLSIRTTNMLDSKSQSSVFDHGEFKESVPQMIPTTGNRNIEFRRYLS